MTRIDTGPNRKRPGHARPAANPVDLLAQGLETRVAWHRHPVPHLVGAEVAEDGTEAAGERGL